MTTGFEIVHQAWLIGVALSDAVSPSKRGSQDNVGHSPGLWDHVIFHQCGLLEQTQNYTLHSFASLGKLSWLTGCGLNGTEATGFPVHSQP
jgi:hypothetical protein